MAYKWRDKFFTGMKQNTINLKIKYMGELLVYEFTKEVVYNFKTKFGC